MELTVVVGVESPSRVTRHNSANKDVQNNPIIDTRLNNHHDQLSTNTIVNIK